MSDTSDIVEQTTETTIVETLGDNTVVEVTQEIIEIVEEIVESTELVERGLPGRDGVDGNGTGGDLSYTHIQDMASAIWTIQHNLGKHPAVTVVDSGDNVQMGDVEYTDLNSLVVLFGAPFGGRAYLN